ncbi:MAG: hypothetical protein Q8P32_01880 [Candidatus Komeilibacteria bacterium]|nr:hypothetical protein [Candidatus Komeilibacteria bacterium]
MKKITIAYHFLLLSFTGLILLSAGWLVFSAYAKRGETKIMSDQVSGLLEYVSVKQVDINNARDLENWLAQAQNSTSTLTINHNPFRIFSQEEESPEIIISPTSTPQQ